MNDVTNKEDQWDSEGSEGELDYNDLDNIGEEEEGDSEGEQEEWENEDSSDDEG